MADIIQDVQQLPAPLASLSEASRLADAQWQVLTAIVDTVVPSILPPDAANSHDRQQLSPEVYATTSDAIIRNGLNEQSLVAAYLAETASPGEDSEYRAAVTRLLYESTDEDQRKQLFFILSALRY